ncbi:DNA polymerase Y family protein [Rhodobacter sp. Har01]|uniref:Y-family DNA polymerase n=1 Tax=Rhodobacter sp. Har01 TaxID=2883999 RepID=UPI001D06E96B|nr:DNA polymerase Y family protein [Rhodobacter sp. Har01]MCB6177745.1 DNA polymerase Y family protein [Rhodobacter sp. Har01]
MTHRRILSLWFPRLAAERVLRQRRDVLPMPFAVAGERGGAQVLVSLNPLAEAAGLREGQPLADATALCPGLLTRPESPAAEAVFLTVLRRWAGKFSPWVAEEPPSALMVDLTGCAHLFGGEAALLAQVAEDCTGLGLTVRAGIADTPGAAWALARFAGQEVRPSRDGDAVKQEARATRSRAARRPGWEKAAPVATGSGVIAPPGRLREVLAPLPLAALRLEPAAVEGLARLGLRRVADILGLPRAALARRFGAAVLKRLDQALGLESEPVSPARAPLHFAVRLTLPEPIGLRADVEAGIDRLLPALCERLRAQGRGARRVRLMAFRADGGVSTVEVGLARAADQPDGIRRLLDLKLDAVEAGFGIDRLRIEAVETEPLHAVQHRGQIEAGHAAATRGGEDHALADLIGRLGVRLGTEQVTRLHPADSHIPEKSSTPMAAAWCSPWQGPWPAPRGPRPLVLLTPEPVDAPEDPMPPARFRWRRQEMATRVAVGPERILPEWWFDDPAWRSGPRDYWRLEAQGGARLWLFYAHGSEVSGGWFCHGRFA